MNYNMNNWPFQWFGFWKEYGIGYENCPSIHDFIDVEVNKRYDKQALINCLKHSHVLVTTSAVSFPSPISGKVGNEEASIQTDGEWLWFDAIILSIEFDGLVIPTRWYKEMEVRGFNSGNVTEDMIAQLNWPPLTS